MNPEWLKQKAAGQTQTHRSRVHALRDAPERDLPIKDALVVFGGAVILMLIMALLAGWLMESTRKHMEKQTARIEQPSDGPAQPALRKERLG